MRSTWRIACVRIPRFPIGAVWRDAIAKASEHLPACQESQRQGTPTRDASVPAASIPAASMPEVPVRQMPMREAPVREAPVRGTSAPEVRSHETQAHATQAHETQAHETQARGTQAHATVAPEKSWRSSATTPTSERDAARGAPPDHHDTPASAEARHHANAPRIVPSPPPPLVAHWDELPIALSEGDRLRAVTAATARHGVRAGMTVAEARARCAALQVLPWDDTAIADAVRQVTAAFLEASPQVTPVAGAPGLWWVGAGGFDSLGGERALARALAHLAQGWHPAPRVAIADSCVAARAATWEESGRRREEGGGSAHHGRDESPRTHSGNSPLPPPPSLLPPGTDAAYLATAPLGLIPMAAELRETLGALGIRTAGAFAALTAEDVERRWGAAGLAAWRLARGEDRRRPGLARPDRPRSASADLVPVVTTVEPILFLVRAALDRLMRELLGDGRAAAAVAITLALDDARGALPSDAPAHTVTREVRLPRPSARVGPLLERCRALLDQWPLTSPVRGVTVAIAASAPLGGEQGDLLEPTWRDPAAADAAFARLRAEFGETAIVIPVARDEHRPERAGGWEGEPGLGMRGEGRGKEGGRSMEARPARGADSPLTPRPSPLPSPPALRQLEIPEAIEVECDGGTPRVLWWRGRRVRVERAIGPERLTGDWWKDGYARDYWRCEEADGAGDLVLYHDRSTAAGEWYVQGWYD